MADTQQQTLVEFLTGENAPLLSRLSSPSTPNEVLIHVYDMVCMEGSLHKLLVWHMNVAPECGAASHYRRLSLPTPKHHTMPETSQSNWNKYVHWCGLGAYHSGTEVCGKGEVEL